MADAPTVVLVAGFDYTTAGARKISRDKGKKVPDDYTQRFRRMCERRTRELFDGKKQFILFDVTAGKVFVDADRSGRYHTEEPDHGWRPVKFPDDYQTFSDPEHYPRFTASDGGVMSITDVYDRIRRINSGQLTRFEIFSHGAPIGPILLNYYQRPEYNWPAQNTKSAYNSRDPLDPDGRSYKDFNANMGGTSSTFLKDGKTMTPLEAFKDSFARDAEIYIWGCSHQDRHFRDIVDDTWIYLDEARGAGTPVDRTSSRLYVVHDNEGNLLPSENHSIDDVALMLKVATGLGYPGRCVMATGLTCHGALPGTYSTWDRGVFASKGSKLMRVPAGDEETDEQLEQDDHSKRFQVYDQLVPGLRRDDRHYAIMTAAVLKSSGIEAAAQAQIAEDTKALSP